MTIKKSYIILFFMILFLGIHIVSNAAQTGVITGETVKMRDGASLEAKLVMLLSVDDEVEVLGKEGDWYHVTFEGTTGYVNANYMKVEGEVEDSEIEPQENAVDNTTVEEPVQNAVTENTGANQNTANNTTTTTEEQEEQETSNFPIEKMIHEEVEVKIIPLIYAETVGMLQKDTTVMLTEEINGWGYIYSEEFSGWVRMEKLVDKASNNSEQSTNGSQPNETNPQDNTEETSSETKAYVNVDSVNVRREASTSSEIVTSVTKNTEVIIVKEENNWCQVRIGDTEGYIAKQYLSDTRINEVTSRSGDFERTKREEKAEVENKAEQVVSYAKNYLGSPYVSGGVDPSGFDCSGYTYYVYKNFGYTLPRTAASQANQGVLVEKTNLQIGDLVFFSQGSKKIGHVGIYIGNNSFIHAVNPQKGVAVTELSDSYYTRNYVTARRIL